MIRSDLALATYRNAADLYGNAAVATPLAAAVQGGATHQSAVSQASPSYKVSLSEQGREISWTSLAKPTENPPFQEPDWQMFANQHKEAAQSEARTSAHIAQLNAEYHGIMVARTQRFMAQNQAHDIQKKQELDAQTAAADAKQQAANRVPLPAPQTSPISEGVKALADSAAQNQTSSFVVPPAPPQNG